MSVDARIQGDTFRFGPTRATLKRSEASLGVLAPAPQASTLEGHERVLVCYPHSASRVSSTIISTGRNTARQQIPIALARLGDVQAVEPLKAVLFKHHDIYGRKNAAYALARLLTRKEDRAAVGKEILAKPELRSCRLPFGKGLIESGDDAGVEFLAIEHAGGYGRLEYPSEILYMLNQRLSVLKGLKSSKVEGFIREALAFKPLRALVLFEPGSAKMRPREYYLGNPPRDEAEELERVAKQVMKTYSELLKCVETNGFKGLSDDLEEIAKQTRNEEIRTMTNACLKSLESPPAADGKQPVRLP